MRTGFKQVVQGALHPAIARHLVLPHHWGRRRRPHPRRLRLACVRARVRVRVQVCGCAYVLGRHAHTHCRFHSCIVWGGGRVCKML